jgi:hypothetical protein
VKTQTLSFADTFCKKELSIVHLNRESIYEVRDGETLRKALIEAEVVEKKCHLYADMAQDKHVKSLFESTTRDMGRAVERLRKLAPKYM